MSPILLLLLVVVLTVVVVATPRGREIVTAIGWSLIVVWLILQLFGGTLK